MATLTTKRESILYTVFISIVFFFYFYKANLTFLGLPAFINSQRICAVMLVAISFFQSGRPVLNRNDITYKKYRRFIIFNICILLYMFLIVLIVGRGEGTSMIELLINQLVVGYFLISFEIKDFKSIDYFMSILIWIHIAQSIIIWLCAINPVFMSVLDLTFNNNNSDWYEVQRGAYAGGIGCITSSGAVKFAFGLVACLYKYLRTSSFKYILLYVFFSLTISVIARTGLLIALVCFPFFLSHLFRLSTKYNIITIGLVVLIGAIFISQFGNKLELFEDSINRYEFLKDGGTKNWIENGYLAGAETELPSLSVETIIGTTITSGVSGNGIKVNVDGGFLRSYVALGLPLAVIFYFVVFFSFLQIRNKSRDKVLRTTILYLILVLLIGELKEPYLFSIIPLPISYLIVLLSESTGEINH